MREVLAILVKLVILVMVISGVALVYTAISRHHVNETPRIEVQKSINTPALPAITPNVVTCIPSIANPVVDVVEPVVSQPVTTTKKHHKYESTVVPLK